MADLQELQKQLNNIEELLGLLVHVSDEKVPQLRNDINDIVKNIKGGLDKEELALQIKTIFNQIINQSDYAKLQANIESTTKKMIDAVESSSRQVDRWRDGYQTRSKWYFVLISLVVGLGIGVGGSYYLAFKNLKEYQQSDLQRYQDVINSNDAYARFVNSSCKNKQSFANFVYGYQKPFDCNKSWLSSASLIKQP